MSLCDLWIDGQERADGAGEPLSELLTTSVHSLSLCPAFSQRI